MDNNQHSPRRPDSFEARLLDAARRDRRQPDVQRAWRRFADSVTSIAAAAEPTSGVHSVDPDPGGAVAGPRTRSASGESSPLANPRAPTPPARALQPASSGAAANGLTETSWAVTRWGAARWLAMGAVLGSSLTAALVTLSGYEQVQGWPPGHGGQPVVSSSGSVEATADAQRERQVPSPAIRRQSPGVHAPDDAPRPPDDPPTLRPNPARPRPAVADAEPTAARAHSIAAEIRALDAARAAGSRGEHERCLELAERFSRDYPNSALLPDAEVLAVEALAALGRRKAATERASRFLSHHPADPHAERVRAVRQRLDGN